MKQRLSYIAAFIFAAASLFAAMPRESAATEKWVVTGNNTWVRLGTSLNLEHPTTSPIDLHVTSSATGDLQFITTSPQISLGAKIKQIALCYQTPNTGTSIISIRLNQYVVNTSTVLIELTPIPVHVTGSCYFSPSDLNVTPAGALNIYLRMNFANAGDAVNVGAMAILVDE